MNSRGNVTKMVTQADAKCVVIALAPLVILVVNSATP
jgi:hypothetical protein